MYFKDRFDKERRDLADKIFQKLLGIVDIWV